MELKLLGYWKSAYEMNLPHPISFVDLNWDKTEKTEVIIHLKTTSFMPYAAAGYSYCRFCELNNNGCLEQSGGEYLWPEGFVHYVENHGVKPPEEFIRHCMEKKSKKIIQDGDEYLINREWWLNQKAHNTELAKSFVDPFEDTYPISFTLTRKEFDKDLLKNDFINFVKCFASKLRGNPIQLFQKLSLDGQGVILDEKQYEAFVKLKDHHLFIKTKKNSH